MTVRALILLAAIVHPTAALASDAPTTTDLRALLQGEEADADGDGLLSRAEFRTRRAAAFPSLDTDGSGKLSQSEFVAAIAPVKGKFVAKMGFSRADANGDGRVDLAEWNALPTEGFDRADQNRDGVLDASEREAAQRKAK